MRLFLGMYRCFLQHTIYICIAVAFSTGLIPFTSPSVRGGGPVDEVREAPGLRSDRLHTARGWVRKNSFPAGGSNPSIPRGLR